MPYPLLELVHLTKRFGSFAAVDDLSLTVDAGTIFGFLGPNGAGKTTTIKMIATLLKPSGGIVRISGIDAHSSPEEAKKYLSYVPDQPYLYEKLSGREFLLFVARIYKMDADSVQMKIMESSEEFGVTPWLDRRIEDYSQGMRQRLIITAAMMHAPRVIVIDEPMVGLDPKGAEDFKLQVKRSAQNGAAVFLTTHQLSLAWEICTRIGIIQAGKLVYHGAVGDISDDGIAGLQKKYLELTSI